VTWIQYRMRRQGRRIFQITALVPVPRLQVVNHDVFCVNHVFKSVADRHPMSAIYTNVSGTKVCRSIRLTSYTISTKYYVPPLICPVFFSHFQTFSDNFRHFCVAPGTKSTRIALACLLASLLACLLSKRNHTYSLMI
jgi:hypothetical protein